jgi:hypothetical protein
MSWDLESWTVQGGAEPTSRSPYDMVLRAVRATLIEKGFLYSMIARTVATWFALMLLAIAHGASREAVLVPRVGSGKAHLVSTAILCILIAVSSVDAMP